ncbi:MAG: NapC/NirT family cytochrome c [Bacillota bacterium]|jgi:cytochrome c nitrite reductase small subunit
MSRPVKTFLSLLGILIASYTLFMALYFPTSEPSFCATCHYIKPYVNSWENQSHKDVKCLFCHEKRGFLGKIDSKSRGLNYFYQEVTNQRTTIISHAKIFEQNCIACHLKDNKGYLTAPVLDLDHFNYLQQDRSCLECHRDTGHKVNIFSEDKFNK